MNGDPIFRAMLIGALAAGTIGALGSFALAGAIGGAEATLFALPFWLFITLAPTVSIAVTLGVAWHRLALRRGWRSLAVYAAPGAAVGFLIPAAAYLLIWGAQLGETLRGEGSAAAGIVLPLLVCVYGAFVGALTGAIAWLIRRPDRDETNPPKGPA
ncbi:MAG: hypothetical protein HXY28_06100 [Hydrogenophilaceae bacterium]|jgi:hypothetical protein|nr:hypothetical protein [Hydrogenophilaceae bacterium]